ncbi:MAG: hypothetical protein ACXW11_12365 [Methylotenera sp.]
MRAKKKPHLCIEEVLHRVSRTYIHNRFVPRDAANYEANLARRISDDTAPVTNKTRDVLLKKSYLTRIKAYAPYAHADAVPLEKSERWLK